MGLVAPGAVIMPAAPFSLFDPAPAERVIAQIGVARELALCGRPAPGRRLCGTLFLERMSTIMADPALLQAFVECLLLLEMTALLPRVLRAVFGQEADMLPLGDPAARRWRLSVSRCVVLLVPLPGPLADRAAREQSAARWSRIILAAAEEPAELEAQPKVRMLNTALN